MNALSNLREKLGRSKRYRESWAASVVKRLLPLQIRVLRKEREWSQADLARESQLTQGVISRAEDPDYGNLNINTLIRIASGFDCAFVGRFVPFSEIGKWYAALDDEKTLKVPSFEVDTGFAEGKELMVAQSFGMSPIPYYYGVAGPGPAFPKHIADHWAGLYSELADQPLMTAADFMSGGPFGVITGEAKITQEAEQPIITGETSQVTLHLLPNFIQMLRKEHHKAITPHQIPPPVTTTEMQYIH